MRATQPAENEWTDYEPIESATAREPGEEPAADAEKTRESYQRTITCSQLSARFTSSTAALAAFRLHPDRFDAVLTDERMPGMSGATLIREVRLQCRRGRGAEKAAVPSRAGDQLGARAARVTVVMQLVCSDIQAL